MKVDKNLKSYFFLANGINIRFYEELFEIMLAVKPLTYLYKIEVIEWKEMSAYIEARKATTVRQPQLSS